MPPETTVLLTARWVLPVAAPPIAHGFVRFGPEGIMAVGRVEDLPDGATEASPHTAGCLLITPGLINTHSHLELTFPAPVPQPAGNPFADWLLAVVALTRGAADSAERLARCRQGVQALLQSGTSCVNDIASDVESVRALTEAGLRGVVSLEFFHPGSDPVDVTPVLTRYRAMAKAMAGNPLLQAGLSPHSPYNVSPAAWQAAVAACQPALIHTHLAESADETAWLAGQASSLEQLHETLLGKRFRPQKAGLGPTGYLQAFGLLGPEPAIVAAHAVQTSDKDREALRRHGVRVAHCPQSNAWLHGNTLHWPDWQDTGIAIGLGTDSTLSNPHGLDIRAEARAAMTRHGWTSGETLARLTREGARVMGMADRLGALSTGYASDIAVWQCDAWETAPPEAMVLSENTRLHTLYVAGRQVFPRAGDRPCNHL